ncbi:MAG TPA: hypothetical protein VGR95_04725, partial [Thermoanaerobaculia bacterium]|nr:hypothetical protein [Thermoanaerobaculia bacterium]
MKARLAAIPVLLLFVLGINAQEAPTQQRGFAPDKVFQVGEFDAVNTFNGNLAIHIPIGPSFPVNGTLSHGLTLFYNSKVWDWEADPENGGASAIPNRHSNAGMGWQVSVGRLEAPISTGNDSPNYVFEDSDGSQHGLNGQLHPGVDGTAGTSYTNDSSYIRASVSSGPSFVELPDGRFDYFDTTGRLTSSQDRFGNSFTITYNDSSAPSPCGPSDTAEWDIYDGQRHVYVCLADQIGYESTNYPSVYHGQFITKVVFPAPPGNGGQSAYVFGYAWHLVGEPCVSNDQAPKSIPMLSTLTLPDASQYVFTYNDSSPSGCSDSNGTLATMWLPTGALVSYVYDSYDEPVEVCSGGLSWFDQVLGVHSKTITGDKIPTAKWTYTQSNNKSTLHYDVRCPKVTVKPDGTEITTYDCKRPPPDSMVTTVTDQLGNVSEHYYSIWPGGADQLWSDLSCQTVSQSDGSVSENGVHDYEFGLPYTKDPTLQSGSFLLSTRTYTASGYASSPRLASRSQYVTYDLENLDGSLPRCISGTSWCTAINPRVSGERTRYFDGFGAEIDHADVTRDHFDGLGHYRHEVLGGSFSVGGADITTAWNQRDANVNPAQPHDGFIDSGTYPASFVMPSTSQPWVLDTLSSITHVEDNSTAIEHRCYDPATGFLRATRQLKQSTDTADATDLVTIRTSTAGNVTREDYYGGDISQNAPTAVTLCAFADTPGTTPEKTVNHTYTTGVLATSKYSGASFNSVNLTIDSQTGLPTQSQGTDGLATLFSYDTSYRLASIRPPGVAATNYSYTNRTGTGSFFVAASVDEKTTTVGAGTIEHIYQYDDLGRLWREKRQMPDNTWSLRETKRNENGWTISVSEWQTLSGTESTFTPSHLTTFGSFDPFGRVGLVTAPDTTTTETAYAGASSLTRTVHLVPGDTGVPTLETYDRQGRLLTTTTSTGGSSFSASYA